MMKRLLIFLLSALPLSSLLSQTSVVWMSSGEKLPKDYITYFLPKTEIIVETTVSKTVYRAGRFANYAKRLLELPNVIVEDKTVFSIDNMSISTNPVPDSVKQFAVAISPKSSAYKLTLDDQNIICGVNSSTSNIPHWVAPVNTPTSDYTLEFDYSLLTEEALSATTEERMAEITAEQILDIRESRMALLSGESDVQYNGNTLKSMLSNLDDMEQRLTALFVGKSYSYKQVIYHSLVPTNAIKGEVLLRFSPQLGVVDSDDYAGYPISIDVDIVDDYDYNIPVRKASKKKRVGIYYNISSKAKVSLYDIEGVIQSKLINMPQFGYATSLPANIFNKKETSIEFNQYGSIKYIK